MIKSRLEQTNSLVNSGDFITIKTPYPINPDNTIILGYYLITNDVIDYQNTILGQFCIVKESEDKVISENDLIWEYLHKTGEGDCEFLKQACSKQIEPYYIYFKFTKLRGNGQIINIDKVSLKIADKRKNKKKFFYYDKSIFKEIDLYNSQNLNWAYSVLDKIKSKGDSIPSFIDRGKDFTTFWGWICHSFSVIVNYGRQFLDIFEDRNLFLEFLRQKDIYRDIRVDLYEDLISNIGNELFYNPILGYKIINHYAIKKDGFIYSGLLNIKENNLIKLKISNSDKSDFNFNIDVDIAFYDNKKAFVQGYTVELNKSNLITELIIERDKNINYVAISYKPIYNKDEIYLVNIYSFGKGSYGIKRLDKKDLLNIYNSFRKRGTKFSSNSIKSLCKTELNDSFFSNYLNSNNIGWFLNKSCPLISHLSNFEKINQIVIDKLTPLNTGEFVEFQDNIIAFSDINVINIKWNKKEWNNSDSVAKNSYIKKVTIFCSLYDINKKAYYPPKNQVILNGDNLNGIVIDNIPNCKTEINIPIQLIENILQKNIINNFVNLDYRDICVFTHLTKDNSIIEFIKIKAIYFELNNQESFIKSTNTDEQYINEAFLGIYFKNISEGIVRINPARLGIGGKQNQLEFEFPLQENKDKIFIEKFLKRQKNGVDIIQTNISEHIIDIQFDFSSRITSNIDIYIYYINKENKTGLYTNSLIIGNQSKKIRISDIRTSSDILGIYLKINSIQGTYVYDDFQLYYLTKYYSKAEVNTYFFDGFKIYYANNVQAEKYLKIKIKLEKYTFTGVLNKGENSVFIPTTFVFGSKEESNKIKDVLVEDEKNQNISINKYLNSSPVYIQELIYDNLICNYDISEMDLENGYKKVPIFKNSNLLGVILIRLNNLYKENVNYYRIQPSVIKRNYLFYENLNGKYDYIPENALIDFGDAFSYYLKPGDVLEHGNSYTTLFDEEINSGGEVVKSKFDSLECNLSFYKLPYNLGFINIKDYYLTYYKNHGQYSDKELENIINLKFLPYYGYKLFLNSSNISSSIYKPMKFLLFEIKNPLDWNSNLGKINIVWKGGCPNYTIIIKGKILRDNGEYQDFNYKQENVDKTKYSKNLINGIYSLIIKDNLGKELNKSTFYIIKPNDINYNIKYYILGGNKDVIISREAIGIYDEVYISLSGGTPPYRISYTNTSNKISTLFVENGRYILLNKIKAPRNTKFIVSITDSNNASKELTLKNDKYFEMYDNGEGTCQLKN